MQCCRTDATVVGTKLVVKREQVRGEPLSRGFARSRIVILDALLKLRQVCCDPRLVKANAAKKVAERAKLDLLMAMLPELVSSSPAISRAGYRQPGSDCPVRLHQGGAKRSAAGDGVSRPPGGKRSAQRRPRREGVRD